jgi:putative molybdopterin biosynthesis protein
VTDAPSPGPTAGREEPALDAPFMNVRQVAAYLQVNQKKIYALVSEGRIPATRVTGKWLFPRSLVDAWLLESSHGGVLSDRLVIAGSDDPLLVRAITRLAGELADTALVSSAAAGTQLGLRLLAARRADVCGIHWGHESQSPERHAALLRSHAPHAEWILVRAFRREQGLIMAPGLWNEATRFSDLFAPGIRWCVRQEGSGSQRFLADVIAEQGVDPANRRITRRACDERDAAAMVAMGQADVAPGVRAVATEFGLDFESLGWECFDLAMHRGVYFRRLLRRLLDTLRGTEGQAQASLLGGYDLTALGEIVWTAADPVSAG